ncbi:MAG: hypothetical protein FWH54_02955 [Methanobrevibacter sp.]|nr:hypothetical protein [Methanobrevibacter sp.]
MYKRTYIKNIIFLIFLLATVLAIVSVSYGATFETVKKIDSGKKIIVLNKEKYKIKWVAEKVTIRGEKNNFDITYKSLKNKKNKGYLHFTLEKAGKNKIRIENRSSPMIISDSKIIKTKISIDKYYWNKLRPKITQFTKNVMFNKRTLKYNEKRNFNKTLTDPINNETVINKYKVNWKVYYFSKISSIEISKRYTNKNNISNNMFSNQDIRIENYIKGKLRITIHSYSNVAQNCGSSVSISTKYVKTNFTPKQYYLHVYKKKLESEILTENSTNNKKD